MPINHEVQDEDEYSDYGYVERTESEKQKKTKWPEYLDSMPLMILRMSRERSDPAA